MSLLRVWNRFETCLKPHRKGEGKAEPIIQKLFPERRTYMHTYLHRIVRYMHAYRLTYIRTYIRTYVHTDIHTYVRTYLPTYLPTYLHTYIHTHTYITYLHTHIQREGGKGEPIMHAIFPKCSLKLDLYLGVYVCINVAFVCRRF